MPLSPHVFFRSAVFLAVALLGSPASGFCGDDPEAVEQNAGGWVHMAAGTKAVFPGIHGGTAPVSLVPLADGRLFALTGKTGQDFTLLIRGKAVETQEPRLPLVESSPSIPASGQEVVLADGQVVTLFSSSPLETSLAVRADSASAIATPQQTAPSRKRSFAPLRLRPYPVLTSLNRDGV